MTNKPSTKGKGAGRRGRKPQTLPTVPSEPRSSPERSPDLDYPAKRSQIVRTWNKLLNFAEAQVDAVTKGESDLSGSLLQNIVKLLAEAGDQLAKLDKQMKDEQRASQTVWTPEKEQEFRKSLGVSPSTPSTPATPSTSWDIDSEIKFLVASNDTEGIDKLINDPEVSDEAKAKLQTLLKMNEDTPTDDTTPVLRIP